MKGHRCFALWGILMIVCVILVVPPTAATAAQVPIDGGTATIWNPMETANGEVQVCHIPIGTPAANLDAAWVDSNYRLVNRGDMPATCAWEEPRHSTAAYALLIPKAMPNTRLDVWKPNDAAEVPRTYNGDAALNATHTAPRHIWQV